MNFPHQPARRLASHCPTHGLVVAAPGGLDESLMERQMRSLAELLGLEPLPWFAASAGAHGRLAQLAEAPPGWMLPLGLDPAADLEEAGCWAEVLGAWRQPLLLLVPAPQVGAGAARAACALLEAEAVPLVGLMQLGGVWQPDRRRRDGLPWLGCLPEEVGAPGSDDDQARQQLRLQTLARWSLSSARVAAPSNPAA